MAAHYRSRINRIRRALKQEHSSAAAVISTSPHPFKSRDGVYPYVPDSDFLYLTGSSRKDAVLFLSSEHSEAILFVPPKNEHKILWEGKQASPNSLAKKIGARLVVSKSIEHDIISELKGVQLLYHSNVSGTLSWKIARQLLQMASFERRFLPLKFGHLDLLIGPFRMIKDRAEVALIREAATHTSDSLKAILPYVKAGVLEREIAARLEAEFGVRNCTVGFPSIVAAGASAATLHYEALNKKLSNGRMLMIDCGAQYQGYAADITRVLPVGGVFKEPYRDIYQIVLKAEKAAIARVKPGVKVFSVYKTAARVLTEGLKSIGVLSGSISTLLKKRAYAPYFPHSIGHNLGIDVHDVGGMRGGSEFVLEKGMVITIEPGLYFPNKIKGIPACGVRIEDDVVVTADGCRILTPGFPKEIDQVEQLFS